MDDVRITLGRHIRSLRRKAGYTQDELAEAAELDPTYIGKIEQGKRLPAIDVLLRIAVALDVPLTALLAPLNPAGASKTPLLDEVSWLLEGCNEVQVRFVADFIQLLRRYERLFVAAETKQ